MQEKVNEKVAKGNKVNNASQVQEILKITGKKDENDGKTNPETSQDDLDRIDDLVKVN